MDVKHFNVSLLYNKLPEDASRIIKKIKIDWKDEDMKFKVFTDGITNRVIGCYTNTNPEDIIIVKVYGENTELYVNRETELKNFKLLHHHGYASKLFATFDNGMVYEYTRGEVVNTSSCRKEAVYPLIARMMAQMHKLRHNKDDPVVSNVWDTCERIINLIPDVFSSPDNQARYEKYFSGGKEVFRREFHQLRNFLESLNNPIVFCHNDLLPENIIYTGNSVKFIDFEFSGYNYQAFDIGVHFIEFAGLPEYDSSLSPSEEFRKKWIRIYLEEYCRNDVSAVDDERVEKLLDDVHKFSLLCHFFCFTYCLVQVEYASLDFDYLKFAIIRNNVYKELWNSIEF